MRVGLFDSGVGGLTVLKELRTQWPEASFVYLGDTARLPYGNKAPETLKKYCQENMRFLDSQKVDRIVVACHSASSVCLDQTETEDSTPLFNVIQPSCEEALAVSKNKKIGLIATKATVKSQVYPGKINELAPSAQVISQECPLLVPLVEESLQEDELTEIILKRYLKPLMDAGVDTILLGCTHYPILKPEIAKICGSSVTLIDPAQSVAKAMGSLPSDTSPLSAVEIFLTDHSPHFIEHAERILGPLEPLKIHSPEES